MIENLAWNTFKQTGNINSYLEFKKIKNVEENIKVTVDEKCKSEWNNNIGK